MTPLFAASLALAASDPVVQGEYLRESGQPERAAEAAAKLLEANADDLAAHHLRVVSEVMLGGGGPLEAEYRDWWVQDKGAPARRVALAMVLGYRHDTQGDWCSDANALLDSVRASGDVHYWATRTRVVVHTRCGADAENDRSELLKIARAGGPGEAEAGVHDALSGYVGVEAPDDLAALVEAHPQVLDDLAPLWGPDSSGPGLIPARTKLLKAAKKQAGSSDPVAVYAAARLYGAIDKAGPADKAVASLKALDAGADPTEARPLDDVYDPVTATHIEVALELEDAEAALKKLDGLGSQVGTDGLLAAYYQAARAGFLDDADREDEAYSAAKKAWELAPNNPVYAERFAQKAAGHEKDLEAGLRAIGIAATNPEHPRRAIHLLVRARLYRGLDRYDEAEADLLELLSRKPTGRMEHRNLGDLYRAMDDRDGAALHYFVAIADPDANGMTAKSKARLDDVLGAEDPWREGPDSLVGEVLELDGVDPSASKVTVVLAAATWWPGGVAATRELAKWGTDHGDGAPVAVVLDRAPDLAALKAEAEGVTWVASGAAPARALRLQGVPTWFALDAEGTVRAAGDAEAVQAAAEKLLK